MNALKVSWHDGGQEPQCAPNPDYPDGIDVDVSDDAEFTCGTDLPYPAKRCGLFVVECTLCDLRVGVTTAGRPDDPRHITIACRRRLAAAWG